MDRRILKKYIFHVEWYTWMLLLAKKCMETGIFEFSRKKPLGVFVGWGPWERNNITCWVDVCPSFMEKWRMWGLSALRLERLVCWNASGCLSFQFTGFIIHYGLNWLAKSMTYCWVWDLAFQHWKNNIDIFENTWAWDYQVVLNDSLLPWFFGVWSLWIPEILPPNVECRQRAREALGRCEEFRDLFFWVGWRV